MIKKIVGLLVLICIMSLGISGVVSATSTDATPPSIPETGDVWDGTTLQPSVLIQKDGIYYYEITKCSELAFVAQNGGDWLAYNYILGNNLILNDAVLVFDDDYNCINEIALLEWIPIDGFTGVFNGNNYAISGMYITTGSDVGLFGDLSGHETIIKNLTLVNSYISADSYAGGIVGDLYANTIENCVFSGVIKSNSCCIGGIVGNGYSGWNQLVSGCVNYGTIVADRLAGGIGGNDLKIENCTNYGNVYYMNKSSGSYSGQCIGGIGGDVVRVYNSKNFGEVTGLSNIGGIAGEANSIEYCLNFGNVNGETRVSGIANLTVSPTGRTLSYSGNYGNVFGTGDYVGGVVAKAQNVFVQESFNCGLIEGKSYCGGIAGYSNYSIDDSYNIGNVNATTYAAGIVGFGESVRISNCYSTGMINSNEYVGALVVATDAIWGDSTITSSYYLKDSGINESILGCGSSGLSTEILGISFLTNEEIKSKNSYEDWDFDYTWDVANDKNGGYPYLQWQDESSLTSIPVTAISLNQATLKIRAGKSIYLSANLSPSNATNKTVVWESSNESIAKVDANGKVTGVSSGTAIITAASADGKISDTCEITVEADAWQEYQINSITIKDISGNELKGIPDGNFLATISITNISSGSDTMVVLAKYNDKGAFEGLIYVSAEDMPIGSTIKLTLPIDNKNGDIAKLKAFSWASFNSLTPMGNSVSFPAE